MICVLLREVLMIGIILVNFDLKVLFLNIKILINKVLKLM